MSETMLTNLYPIEILSDSITIRRLSYRDGLLEELRSQFNSTHSFFRSDDYVYISHMEGPAQNIGEEVTINIKDNRRIVSSLIKHLFFRTFRRIYPGYVPESFYPFRIVSRRADQDLIRDLLPSDLKDDLGYKELITIHLREIKEQSEQKIFCLAVEISHRWIFNRSLAELIKEGYNPVGRTVRKSEPIPGLEGVLAPDETLIGKIKKVNDDTAIVETNEGEETYKTDALYLRKSRADIGSYLSFKLGMARANRIFNHIFNQGPKRLSPENMQKEIQHIANLIGKLPCRNSHGFSFKISTDPFIPSNRIRIEPTSCIFDPTPGCSNGVATRGLALHGPYDSKSFDIKTPSILVICLKSTRGSVSSFLGKLVDGMPQSNYYRRGFKDLFRLHSVTFKIEEADRRTPEAFEKAITSALASGENFDLAIVEGDELVAGLEPNSNPYYRSKAKLMNAGLPVQGIRTATFRDGDISLQYKLAPLALQLYAKLGGVPWVLPATQNIDREIIVGIGNRLIRRNPFAGTEQSRIVGLTTFFLGDGQYLLGRQLTDVPYEKYFDELLRSLENSINSIAQEYGWEQGDTVRIIFHIFKPIKDIEAEVVNKLVSKYTQFTIRFAFVTISERHPYQIFSNVIEYKKSRIVEPKRGANFLVDGLTCVIQLLGRGDRKSKFHKFSDPVQIRIHESSTYQDIVFVCQQIQHFCYMSWRNLNPIHTPVTILYANLIAKLSSNLKQVNGWNPDVINARFGNKKWFL